MTKLFLALAGVGVAIAAVPTVANAAPWQSINQRQANLYARIEQGIRSGALNRPEAARLKTQFQGIANLEYRYRRTGGGLSAWERRDLDQRFNTLSSHVYTQKHDWQTRR